MADELVLASLSPFRAQLVKNAGLSVKVEGADIDERAIEKKSAGLPPEKLAQLLAEEKACKVSLRFPHALVIGCDQVLALDGEVLHKPADMQGAYRRLLALSGKTHHLHSAVALYKKGDCIWSYAEQADMTVRPLDPQYAGYYLARVGADVLASVGAYQIEGEGIQLFEKIDGDYFTIVGLPLLALLAQLRKLGVIDG